MAGCDLLDGWMFTKTRGQRVSVHLKSLKV